MSGIDEVARVAGVSIATVSRALSGRGAVAEATRARVLRTARELGYVVSSSASGLATGRTRTVGVVVPSLTHWFWASVVEGAEAVLREQDYDLSLYNIGPIVDERQRIFEHFLQRKRVDALLAISLELTADELESLVRLGKPIVGVGGPLHGIRTVGVDDVALAELATSHLVGLGHRFIAHLAGDAEHDHDFHVPTHRRTGYERALRHAGLEPDPSLVVAGDFTLPGGYRATKELLARARPTGIVAASDDMAVGALLAARDAGLRVPQDLSVVGIDGHGQAEFFELTTVAQRPEQQGRLAASELLRLLSGDDVGSGVCEVDVELVVRGSTAPPAEPDHAEAASRGSYA